MGSRLRWVCSRPPTNNKALSGYVCAAFVISLLGAQTGHPEVAAGVETDVTGTVSEGTTAWTRRLLGDSGGDDGGDEVYKEVHNLFQGRCQQALGGHGLLVIVGN